jgi:tetratricopeptide (TPR) repeat protein
MAGMVLATGLSMLVFLACRDASAQAGAGAPVSGGTGICSSGGCLPRSECGPGSLCSPFPEHPAYDPTQEFRKGVVALNAHDYAKAKWEFDRVLYLAPTNSDALFAEGIAETGLGDLKGAAEAYAQALKWNPKQINAARELAITDVKLDQADLAMAQLAALKARASKCADTCRDAQELKSAISAIEVLLPPRS